MRNLTRLVLGGLIMAAGAVLPGQADATMVGDGTVSIAALYNPVVDLTASPSTYQATLGNTFQISGEGGFAAVAGKNGYMNGTLSFLGTSGATLAESIDNFFVFNDGVGGTYNFSATSVSTKSFDVTPGVSSSVSLFILGTTVDLFQGLTAAPTSLTLSFNNTGASAYAASATLAVPPASMVPEAATWAMMLCGFASVGATMRVRRRARPAIV